MLHFFDLFHAVLSNCAAACGVLVKLTVCSANSTTIVMIAPIYTTNAVESLNSVIRAATKGRKVFPTDESAKKVIYLAIEQASKKWTMPIQNWKMALSRFVMDFGDRLANHQ